MSWTLKPNNSETLIKIRQACLSSQQDYDDDDDDDDDDVSSTVNLSATGE